MFSFSIKHLIDVVALLAIYVFILYKRWQGKRGFFIKTTLYVYLSFVLFFTLMPVITSLPFILNHPYVIHLIPFDDYINGRGDFVRQVALNVIMTVPFGLLLPFALKKKDRSLLKVTLFTFLLSLMIEVLQPLINGIRSFDVTDLITNTTGGIIGYFCYTIIKPFTKTHLAVNRRSRYV